MALEFVTDFDPLHGKAVTVADGVERVTVNNPGPLTFHGTNSYIIGEGNVAVLDPGPDDDVHLNALLNAIGKRTVSHILVSHTHADHSPLAAKLKAATGAPVCAEGPHRAARPLRIGEINPLDAAADSQFEPDIVLADGALIEGDGWTIETVHTPGHTANHAAFALHGTGVLFSADHVMGWATSIVAPPDGAMGDYMASLQKLMERDDRVYLPGHGGAIENPARFVRGLCAHRLAREDAVVTRLSAGDRKIPDMVREIYRDIDPRLHGAAALSMLAHIEDLVARGIVEAEGDVAVDSIFRLK